MTKLKKKNKETAKRFNSPFSNTWTKGNFFFLGLGFIILLAGFILMAQGPWDNSLSLSVSPVVLLLAYLVVVPIAIFYKKQNKESEQANTDQN